MSSAPAAASSTSSQPTQQKTPPVITASYTNDQPVSLCEQKAMRQLVQSGLLYISEPEKLPLKDLRTHPKLVTADTPEQAIHGNPFKGEIHHSRAPDYMKPCFKELDTLHSHLCTEVGDDVIAGTIFAVKDQTDEEKLRLQKEAEAKKLREKQGLPDGDDHDDDITKKKLNPGCQKHEPHKAVTSFTVGFWGQEFQFPICEDDVCSMHAMMKDSYFGKEGHGTIIDDNVRRSKEVEVDDTFVLPDFLHHPRTIYPELEMQIRERLAPTAKHIAIKPYKLVAYGPGDFFAQHVDSSDDPRHFGTLTIHLPCAGDFSDDSNFIDPDFHTYGDSKGEDADFHSTEDYYLFKRYEANDDDEEDESSNDDPKKKAPPAKTTEQEEAAFRNDDQHEQNQQDQHRAVGGALKFYLGRSLDKDSKQLDTQRQPKLLSNSINSYAGSHNSSSSQLVASVLFQNYSKQELYDGKTRDHSVCANSLSDIDSGSRSRIGNRPGDESISHVVRKNGGGRNRSEDVDVPVIEYYRDENDDGSKKSRKKNSKEALAKKQRKYTPCHFAAWTTNTLHSVRPLRKGYRVVLTYKIYKVGELSIYHREIPRHQLLSTQMERVISSIKKSLSQHAATLQKKRSEGQPVFNNHPTSFGFLCRHFYSVSAVGELGPYALKGIDLAAYRVIAEFFEPIIAPVFLGKDLDSQMAFNLDRSSRLRVFMTAEHPCDKRTNQEIQLARECVDLDLVSAGVPLIRNVMWNELGLSKITTLSASYGNWDCGAQHWYKNFCIVASSEPGRWSRRRWCFVAQYKSKDPNCLFKRIGEYYPIFRNVCFYL